MSISCSDYIPSCLKTSDDTGSSSRICWLRFVLPAVLLLGAAGSVLLLFRFTITPQVKAYVEDARLNSFVSTDTRSSSAERRTFFAYNISISVALTVRNLNTVPTGITYTKPLMATFVFHDRRLYNVTVADKGHKHKPLKREVHLFHTGGEVPCVLDTEAVDEFKKQNATGVLKVEMRLSGGITLGIGNNRGLELSCPLMLRRPPPPPVPDVVLFNEVDCEPAKPKKIVF